MAPFKSTFRFTFWHIVVLFLLMALVAWYWFGYQIDTIESQIEKLHK